MGEREMVSRWVAVASSGVCAGGLSCDNGLTGVGVAGPAGWHALKKRRRAAVKMSSGMDRQRGGLLQGRAGFIQWQVPFDNENDPVIEDETQQLYLFLPGLLTRRVNSLFHRKFCGSPRNARRRSAATAGLLRVTYARCLQGPNCQARILRAEVLQGLPTQR